MSRVSLSSVVEVSRVSSTATPCVSGHNNMCDNMCDDMCDDMCDNMCDVCCNASRESRIVGTAVPGAPARHATHLKLSMQHGTPHTLSCLRHTP